MISPPKKMRIITIDETAEFGQNLIEDHVDVPSPSSGEVLIKVAYAGINRPDILQRKGMHPPAPGAPDHPGLEVSGHIVAFGDNTPPDMHELHIGDEICALLGGGGYGEYVCAPIACCLPVLQNLSLKDAASLPECLWTVWNNLFLRGELTQGETTLIHGGTSGIGHFAIQMAKAAGARVIATAGSDEKVEACKTFGADLAINYKTEDFETEIIKHYGEDAVDVVLDMVGGDYVPQHIRLLKLDGRHINIAFLRGKEAEIDLSLIMKKRLMFSGSTLRQRPLEEKATLAQGLYHHVWPWISRGAVQPHIDSIYPFTRKSALSAHQKMMESTHTGKMLLALHDMHENT